MRSTITWHCAFLSPFSTFLFICHSQSSKILSKVYIAGVLCLNTLNKLSPACMLLAFQGEKFLRGRERERERRKKKEEREFGGHLKY